MNTSTRTNIPQSKGGNDECYTPAYGVEPLIKYIPKNKTVWCPFDTEESQYVIQLKENGNKVIHSHIWNNQDFFAYEPKEHYDMIISNPPFSDKNKILKRLMDLGKPFAMLLPHSGIADGGIYTIFDNKNNSLELMLFDRRMEFVRPNRKTTSSISFKAIYYCHNILPEKLILAELPKPNVRRPKIRTDLSYDYNPNQSNNPDYKNEEGVA
jgi:hypothetical protein